MNLHAQFMVGLYVISAPMSEWLIATYMYVLWSLKD